jgi:hypothetical protein
MLLFFFIKVRFNCRWYIGEKLIFQKSGNCLGPYPGAQESA